MQFSLKRKVLVVLCVLLLSCILVPSVALAEDDTDDTYVVSLTTVSKDGANSVAKVSGGGVYNAKDKATVIAYPRIKYVFCGWYDAEDTTFSNQLSNSADYTFSVTADRNLVALYERNTDATFNLEVYGSKYKVNNSSQNGAYSQKFNSGEKMFLSYTDDAMEFRYWVDKSGNIVSTAKDYSFILSGDTSMMAYYTPLEDRPDQAVVYFRNAYSQLFSTRTYSVSESIDFPNLIPIKMGSVFKGWFIADANGNPSSVEATTESIHAAMAEKNAIVIVPDYYESTELYTLNIEYTDGNTDIATGVSENVAIGEVKILNAPAIADYSFAYWMLEDQIISYDKKVSIRRGTSDAVTLKAVYSKEAVEQDALVVITQMFSSRQTLTTGEKYVLSTIMQFYIPSDCVMSKNGFVYGTNRSLFDGEAGAENLVLGGVDVLEKESGISQRRGIYTYNVTTSDPGKTLYIRGYVVYKDKNGALHTIYTDVRSCSYKSMNGVTCNVTFLGDGDSVLQSSDVLYGTKPVYEGETPEKQSDDEFTYTFAGWTPDITFATEDAVYKAVFDAVPIPAPEPPAAEVTSAAAKENIQLTNIADMSPDTKTVRAISALYAFKALDPAADVAKYYDGWKSDFRVSFDRNIEVGSFGFYGAYNGYGTEYEATFLSPASFSQGEALMLLQAAGLTEVTYYDVHKNIEEFICGVFNLEESNLGTKMRVELVIWEDGTDASEGIVIAAEEYTFDAVTQLDCIHSFGEWTVTTDPTCTKTGVETRVCEYCGESETREVSMKQHTPGEAHKENVIPATCTDDGSYDMVVRCAVCENIIYSNSLVIPKYPSVEVIELEPRTEVVLNDIENNFVELPKLIEQLSAEHLFRAVDPEEATFNAYNEWMCDYRVTFNGAFDKDSFGLFGEYSGYGKDYSIAFLFPSNVIEGESVYLLQAAGLGEVTYNDMLNNIESFDCGLFNVNAANVGKSITVELVIWDAVSGIDSAYTLASFTYEIDTTTSIDCIHSFGDWKVTTGPTCTKTGEETRVCAHCGESETREVSMKQHTLGEAHKENEVPATGTDNGSYDMVVRCAVCENIIYSNSHVVPKYPSVEVIELEPRTEVVLNDIENNFVELPKLIEQLNAERLFRAVDPEEATFNAYNEWMCDYRVTFNGAFDKDSFGLFGEYSGYGKDYSIAFLFPSNVIEGESVYLLQAAGLGEVTYNDMLHNIETFDCGLFNVDASNVGKSITVELVIWDVVSGVDTAFTLSKFTYEFDSTTTINCIHSFGDWKVTTEPTCTKTGEETRICAHCGESETREVLKLDHDLTHHDVQAATCTEIGWEAYDTCSRCDYTTYVQIPALGHDKVHHDAQAATCTEIGWEAYDTCSRCDYTTYVQIPALGHDKVHHDAQAATCTEIGWEAYDTCSRCDYTTYVEIPALGHDKVHHDVQAATCTAIGWEAYDTCSRCDYTTYVEIPALGHDKVHHDAHAANCTEIGWEAYDTCSRCDYTTYVEIPALGHDKVHHDAQAANCTEIGWEAYDTCSRCDYTTYVQIPSLGHDKIHHDAQAATCTSIGWEAYDTCSRCDYTTYVEIPALGHDKVHHDAQAATCTEIGWEAYDTCSRCDYTTYVEIPALGHDKVHHDAQAATCTSIGWEAYDTCSRCDYTTYVEIPALGHDKVHHDAQAANCTEIGWEAYDTCSRCDYSTYVEIPSLGHDKIHHDAQTANCTEIGWEAYDTCSRCDYSTYVEIPSLGHDKVHHDAQAATCTEIGWEAYDTCSRCDYSTYVEIPSLGHDKVHHDAQAATCTEIGWEAYDTCSRCDYSTYVEIPALGHDKVHHDAQAENCTAIGWEAYDTCSRCDYTTYVEIPALGHDKVHYDAQAATCTAIGWEAYDTCSRCDYSTYVEIPSLGHDKVHHDAQAATCTAIGWEAYDTCSRCDYTTYVEIPALGHDKVHHDAQAATCTEISWEAYDTCSRCDYTTYIEIPALGHDWNNPTWTWDGVTSATATFVCKHNSNHSETRVATGDAITSEIGTGENAGYLVYTATVTFNDQQYSNTTLVQILASNSFTHSDNLAHVDTYLYRVGNGNAVALGTLFKAADPSIVINPANVKIKIVAAESNSSVKGSGTNLESGSTAKCVYTKDSSDWTKSTLKFTGEGPVRVTIKIGDGEEYDLNLEVVTGNNFTENTTLSGNANIVLLGNVKVGASSDRNSALTLNGKGLYGNGFEIDCSGSNISSKAFGIISLTNAMIDNTIVKGPTYTDYDGKYGSDNYAATIVCYDNAVITNCRISGAADPVCVYGTNVKVSDTILSGGVFANMHIRNRGGVTVSNVTTVNTQNSLAIVFYLATSDSYIVINGELTQHNFISENASMSNSSATTLKSRVFNNMYSRYHFTDGSTKYANLGIVSLDDGVNENNIIDNRSDKKNYSGMTASFSMLGISVNGYVYTMENVDSSMLETTYTEPAYVPSTQNPYEPVFSWAVPSGDNIAAGGDVHCYKDSSGVLQVQFINGDNKTINANDYAVFKKYQGTAIEPVSITCKNNGSEAVIPVTNGSITFDLAGTYTVSYQYNGVPVYDKNLNTTLLRDYTKTITVNVSTKKNAPNAVITSSKDSGTIAWGGAGSSFDPDYNPCIPFLIGLTITDYDANGNAYTVLDGSNQSDFIKSIASVSVSGTNVTIVLANGTKLVVKGPSVDGTVQVKAYNNIMYYCDSTADNNPGAFTKTFAKNSYTYTGENGVAVSYGTARSFTSTTSTNTIAKYANMGTPWTSNKFLMFDAQGGILSPTYFATSPATLPTPAKEGFTFVNWNTKADGTGTARNAGTSMTFSSNTTLYAIWAANVTVIFDGNGGSDPAPISAGAGTDNILPTATLNGAWLEGWYTDAYEGAKIGNAGASFTMPNGDTTYFAHWLPKIGVVYNANGGTVDTESAVYEGTALILPTPVNGSKTFEGWFTAQEGGTKVGTAGDSYIPVSNITLYAQWSDNILVSFNSNGGLADTNSLSYDNVSPIALPGATWTGHRFDGWYTAASGGDYAGTAGNEYVPSEPVTLYAHWTAFKMTFEAEGGSVNPANATAGDNGAVTLPTPTRTGYKFKGWFTASSGGTKIGNGGDSYTLTEDITVHAQWTVNTYKITIKTNNSSTTVSVNGTSVGNGGSVAYNSVVKVVLSYSQSNNKTFTIKQGNTNVTRYSNEACTSTTTSTDAGTYYFKMPAGDVTIDSSSASGGSSCIPSGTMITLADGSKKPVEQITLNDRCLVFNHETGTTDTAGIIFFEADGVQEYNVVNLAFSDGSTTRLIYEHGYFDMDLMKYVYIREDNYTSFIGHRFYKASYNGTDYSSSVVTLTDAWITSEVTGCFSFPTEYHLNFFADDFLSMPGGINGMFNFFDFDLNLKYDEVKKTEDIATFGLLDYSFFEEYMTYEEFSQYPAQYLSVSLGKCLMTEDWLEYLIERYVLDKR